MCDVAVIWGLQPLAERWTVEKKKYNNGQDWLENSWQCPNNLQGSPSCMGYNKKTVKLHTGFFFFQTLAVPKSRDCLFYIIRPLNRCPCKTSYTKNCEWLCLHPRVSRIDQTCWINIKLVVGAIINTQFFYHMMALPASPKHKWQ